MSKEKREYVYIDSGCTDARDIAFKCIPGVEPCRSCHANGKREQFYIEGRMTGPCDLCGSMGFVYVDTARPVPLSVLNQIAVASDVKFRHFESIGIDWGKS